MRFPGFYGNAGLKARLSAAGDRGSLSHCYILEGPEGSGKKTLARILAAAMECEAEGGGKPCGVCPACRKALGQGHPDIITIDSDTATVPIRLIRGMQTDAFIRPNEGRKKVYVIPRAQAIQSSTQNVLLKLLEEPPSYCAFLLLTESAGQLLTTVRSRAVTLTLFPLEDSELLSALRERFPEETQDRLAAAAEESQGYLGQAISYLESPEDPLAQRASKFAAAFSKGDELSLLQAMLSCGGKRPELLSLLSRLYRMFTTAMTPASGGARSQDLRTLAASATEQQLYASAQAISHGIRLLQANGNCDLVIGAVLAELRLPINKSERS